MKTERVIIKQVIIPINETQATCLNELFNKFEGEPMDFENEFYINVLHDFDFFRKSLDVKNLCLSSEYSLKILNAFIKEFPEMEQEIHEWIGERYREDNLNPETNFPEDEDLTDWGVLTLS